MNALEHELAGRLKLGACLDRRVHLGIDENLTGARLRAQTGSKIDDRSHRSVVESTLEADGTERCISVSNANAEAQLMAMPAPLRDELAWLRISTAICAARKLGSGHGTGSLKNTMMPSPVKRSTVPPCS